MFLCTQDLISLSSKLNDQVFVVLWIDFYVLVSIGVKHGRQRPGN